MHTQTKRKGMRGLLLVASRTALLLLLTAAINLTVLPQPKAKAATSGAVWPTSGRVTSMFHQGCPSSRPTHAGIDIANETATVPVYAAQDGTAYRGNNPTGYGTFILIAHTNGYKSLYAHLASQVANSGQFVRQNDLIGYMGSTGARSTGKHLHFEMRNNASYGGNLDGSPMNFNDAIPYENGKQCDAFINAQSVVNHNFPGLVGISQTMVANVNNCNALYIKRSLWGNWDQHMGCGQAKTVSLSPDGNTIVVIRPDNTLVAKQGYWGDWAQHAGTGASIAAAAGPGGMIGHVTSCGSVYIKTSYWGTWQEHMGCGQATDIAIAPNGQTIVVRRPDGALVAKETFWGNWAQHTASGDSQSVAAGPNGMIGNVNGCGAVWVKRSYWGNWDNHSVCNVQRVALGPDGQKIAAVNGDGLWIKSTYTGTWERHAGSGDSKSAAIAEQ